MRTPVFTGERIIPELDNYFFYEHLARYKLAKQHVTPEMRVLDVGCGDGYGSFFLSSVVEEVVGIDIAADTIKLAKERYPRNNLRYQHVDPDQWGLPANYFDLVTCFEVFEHVHHPEQLLRRIKSVLRGGGILVMSTPNKDVYGDNLPDPYHVKEYTLDEFHEIVGKQFMIREVLGQRNENQRHKKRNFWLARQAMRFPFLLRLVNWSLSRKPKKHLQPGYLDALAMHGNYFSRDDPKTADYFVAIAVKNTELGEA